MKLFAFFLPQFHEIPENNQWWGEGFTEWVKVKEAKPVFKNNHIQPIHPLNGNYYNLLEKDTVLWQTKLMKDYGVDGMIYYHYYFNGKLLLEKPAENLLKWKEIDQPFFFCWANHNWNRAWNGSRELLMAQTYGDETSWEAHFQYLLPFFLDERYEKREGKPLFMIYDGTFPEKREMVRYFDRRCRENGFQGLCVIESFNGYGSRTLQDCEAEKSDSTDFINIREPDYSLNMFQKSKSGFRKFAEKAEQKIYKTAVKKQLTDRFSADTLYGVLKEKLPQGENYIQGAFFQWDNTPRHKDRGYRIDPVSEEVFLDYLDGRKDDPYVFINAWNEWAEGMMLEPTEEWGYRYLEWIREWKDEQKKNV